jgi:aminoglycoside phosphotransferase
MPIKKKTNVGHAVRVGTGIAAGIAGALAGGYLLYQRTKPQQKQAKAWVLKARKEAAVEAKKAKLIGEKEYHRIVEKAIKHYGAIEKVGAPEIASVIRDAKAEWKHIEAQAKKAAKLAPVAKKTVKHPAKKAVKKVVRK